MKSSEKIAFVGGGNMAEALIGGVLNAGIFSKENIIAGDPLEGRRDKLSNEFGIEVTADNREVVASAGIVVLAVKPQVLDEALAGIRETLRKDQLLISILAGVTTKLLEEKIKANLPVVRVMPNTPALVRAGMSAICGGKFAAEDHLAKAEKVLGVAGKVVRVPESLMDSVTAISGSGPAYLFLFTEALIETGRQLGFDEKLAGLLAVETVIGAAKLLEESGESPAALREKVTSPGGTTEAALKVLAEGKFKETVRQVAEAARRRSGELGRRRPAGKDNP